MLLNDSLQSALEILEKLWVKPSRAPLNDAIDGLGYNAAGLICAQLRASGDASLAAYIERRRFK